ncbi:MAG: flavodoxin family protein [Clostridiales bacterium]|nr:flavodoxin family protein [Clostridiales bacterium]MCF8023699.1 flavodoxin family protein [Clostridiales bacterium]
MNIVVLNSSPRKDGTITHILKGITSGIAKEYNIEWINLYDYSIKPCTACMKCRPDDECILPEDGGQIIGRKIRDADGLIIGTPTHWGNMSALLKSLFDRNMTAFIGEKTNGMPFPRQKGKPAIIVTACTAPWPFNFITTQSRGAASAVHRILHSDGYKLLGKIIKPGTNKKPQIPQSLLNKAKVLGGKL